MAERNATTQSGKKVKPELIPFARWLVGCMKERRLDNNQLALKLGVSTGAISEYRRALRRPRRDAREKIAREFGEDPDVVERLLEGPAPLAGNGAASGQVVIDLMRAYLDTLELELAAGVAAGEPSEEARAMIERGNRPPNGSAP